MLNIEQETAGRGATLLKLQGELGVEAAAQLRQTLLDAFEKNDQLLLDCAETTAIDLFCLQLLCSAHRTSVAWDKQLSFQGDLSPAVKDAQIRSGFNRHMGCSLCPEGVRCMWI